MILPALEVAEPTRRSGAKATATDVLHHLMYATVAGVASDWLEQR